MPAPYPAPAGPSPYAAARALLDEALPAYVAAAAAHSPVPLDGLELARALLHALVDAAVDDAVLIHLTTPQEATHAPQ